MLIFARPSLMGVNEFYNTPLIKIYLSIRHLNLNGFNFNYLCNFVKKQIFIYKYVATHSTHVFHTLANIRNLWYPLFKKHSYFGYSRFTRFTQNRFFKNKNK